MATDDLSKPPADQFNVIFRFATQPAHELVVRDVTNEIFGVDNFTFRTGAEPTVLMSPSNPVTQTTHSTSILPRQARSSTFAYLPPRSAVSSVPTG